MNKILASLAEASGFYHARNARMALGARAFGPSYGGVVLPPPLPAHCPFPALEALRERSQPTPSNHSRLVFPANLSLLASTSSKYQWSQSAPSPDCEASDPGWPSLGAIIYDARRLFRRRRRNPLARSSGAGAATDGPKLDQAERSSNALLLRAKARVKTDRRKVFSRLPAQQSEKVCRFVSVGPRGRRPRRIASAQGAAPFLRESLQEASISKKRRQIMTLTSAPTALSRRLEEAQSRRFKGGMMSFSSDCCPFWRRDADKRRLQRFARPLVLFFAIRMRFAQWAKHPGRKPAATILAVKATIYGLGKLARSGDAISCWICLRQC